jgi:hypothetical protein
MARGRRSAHPDRRCRPDILFATEAEAGALLDGLDVDGLLAFSRIAVVKRGAEGATVLARVGGERLRFDVATARMETTDRRAPATLTQGSCRLARGARPVVRWQSRSNARRCRATAPPPVSSRRPVSR